MNIFSPLVVLSGQGMGLVFGIAGLVIGLVFGLYGMHLHHQRRTQWHELAKLALEKGQPIPERSDDGCVRAPSPGADIRSGLISIATGAGLYLFFEGMGLGGLRFVGAIPCFVGAAMILFGLFGLMKSNRSADADLPRRP